MKRLFFFLLLVFVPLLPAKIYKGAEYRTKASYTYGRFEVRMKSAHREGVLSTFFTYNDDNPNTAWNEIDIEILGRYADDIQFNPITPGQINHVSHYQAPFSPHEDFHVYAFEWTPTYVAWFVDSVEVHRQTGTHIQQLNLPQKIMMNIWNPVYANWVGEWNENVLPAFAYYDWVRYSSYTPGTGTSGTGNNFTVQWKDDFDAWDQERWEKATHTFNGNQCDFVQANAVFRDGSLILCLTKENALGYNDNAGPGVKFARAEEQGVLVKFSEEVDPVSAQFANNYINTAMPVTAAVLQRDSQSVFLTLSNYQKDSLQNIIIANVKDRSASQNSSGVRNIFPVKSKPLTFPVKINCGGPAYKDYLPDQEWGPSVEYGRVDATVYQNTAVVSGALDPDVYKSELNGIVRYRVRVPDGTYTVILMMAENYFTAAGKRKFSVAVNGTPAVQDLDIFAQVGKGAQCQKVVNNVKAKNGMIELHFTAAIDNPLLNGLVIIPVSVSVPDGGETMPAEWKIGQNFPNPFNGRTVIPVQVMQDDHLSVSIFDLLGRKVAHLPVGPVQRGMHLIPWSATDLRGAAMASGPYVYVVEGRLGSSAKKMLLLQ